MKTYEKYKDSGMEWIGKVPEHWEIKKLKYLVKDKLMYGANESAIEENPEHPRFIRITDFGNDGKIKENTFKSLPPEKANDFLLKDGDILFARSGATVGKTFQFKNFKGKACFAGYLIKASPNGNIIESDLITFFTQSGIYENWKNSIFSQATIQNIGADKYSLLEIPVPPKRKEQTTITNYLDKKTAEIDQLISEKEQLVTLYQEEKTAIINQAATKGINPDVMLKDSGIKWLGDIPEHWEIKKLRYLCKITTGNKDTENREDDAEYPFFVRSQTIEKISTYSFDGEAILTAGDGVGVCKVWHYANGKFDFHQRVYMIYDFEEISGRLLFHFLKQNFIHEVLKKSAKSTVDSLRRPMFLDFPVAYSKDKTEQTEIVKYIEKESEIIDAKIAKAEKYINLLTEYRTALISEVVTGKIKVID